MGKEETTTAPLANALWITPKACTGSTVATKVEVDVEVVGADTVTVTVIIPFVALPLLLFCRPAAVGDAVGKTIEELVPLLIGPSLTPACSNNESASTALIHDRN